MHSDYLKKKLKNNNNLSIGSWISLYHPSIAEIMCHHNFDWIAIDLEHSSISLDQAENLMRIINSHNKCPLPRLSTNDPTQIKRLMDLGAGGIIVPQVSSIDDVEKSFKAMTYPPLGNRGVGLSTAQSFGKEFKDNFKWTNDSSLLIVQIEDISAIENLDEIFSSDMVDGYLLGPYDLSASMGIPGDFENQLFIDGVQKIRNIAKKYKLSGGVHIVEIDPIDLEEKIQDGFNFIAFGVDHKMISSSCLIGCNSMEKFL